jgi:hypothetical protein
MIHRRRSTPSFRYRPRGVIPPPQVVNSIQNDSAIEFRDKISHLLNQLYPQAGDHFTAYVNSIIASIVKSPRSRSRRSPTKKKGGYNWRPSSSTKSAYKKKSSKISRQSGGLFWAECDKTAAKCLILFLGCLFLTIICSNNIRYPTIPAHADLIKANISTNTVMIKMPPEYQFWPKNLVDFPEISPMMARMLHFTQIIDSTAFREMASANNNDHGLSSKIFKTCNFKHNPIIPFINYTALLLFRGEYYCQKYYTPDIRGCLKILFGPQKKGDATGTSVMLSNPMSSDLNMALAIIEPKPKSSSSSSSNTRSSFNFNENPFEQFDNETLFVQFNNEIVNFMDTFYQILKDIPDMYKTNEIEYNKAINPPISAWNYFGLNVGILGMAFFGYFTYANAQQSKKETEERRLNNLQVLKEASEVADKMKAIREAILKNT